MQFGDDLNPLPITDSCKIHFVSTSPTSPRANHLSKTKHASTNISLNFDKEIVFLIEPIVEAHPVAICNLHGQSLSRDKVARELKLLSILSYPMNIEQRNFTHRKYEIFHNRPQLRLFSLADKMTGKA